MPCVSVDEKALAPADPRTDMVRSHKPTLCVDMVIATCSAALLLRTKLGDRAFSVAGPVIWNSIPESIRSVNNIHTFKRLLKTHFLTNSADFMSLHSAAILAVLCYFVLPRRSGSRKLGITLFIRLD